MRAFVAVLLFTLALSGCMEDPAPPADDSPPSGPTAEPRTRSDPPVSLAFEVPAVLGTMLGGAEPSIAVAPDGTVYVTTPLSLWRSDDGGKTWKTLGTPVCPVGPMPACPGLEESDPDVRGGGDADIYAGPDGRVHWLGLFDGDNAIPYQVSDDKGETWSDVVDLAGDDSGDREWITGRADGTLFAAWRNFPPTGDRDPMIVSRTSLDGGATWTPPSNIAADTRQGGIAADPSSNALALAYDTAGGEIHVAHSFDNGTTWDSVELVDDAVQGHIFPVLAFDSNGTLYAAWAHDRDGVAGMGDDVANRPLETPSLHLAVSHDKGLTWTDSVQVNAPGTTAWFPWIAAGSAGRVVLVWYQNDRGLPRQTADEVYVMAAVSLDADWPQPRFTQARVSPDPIHRGPECRENPGCTRSLLDFFEVAIHPDGFPVLTWAQDLWPVPRVSVAASFMTRGPNLLE